MRYTIGILISGSLIGKGAIDFVSDLPESLIRETVLQIEMAINAGTGVRAHIAEVAGETGVGYMCHKCGAVVDMSPPGDLDSMPKVGARCSQCGSWNNNPNVAGESSPMAAKRVTQVDSNRTRDAADATGDEHEAQ